MYKNQCAKRLFVASIAMAAMVASAVAPAAESKGTIRLSEVDWTGGLVDMTLAKIILEEEMGYEVETVYLDTQALWVAAAGGDVDLIVERWPSVEGKQMEAYLKEHGGTGEVLDMGHMGIVGNTGYYVPRYVIEGDAERGIEAMAPDLKSWEQLNKYKDLFKSLETGDKGRWVGCPVRAWDCRDDERIAALGLDYTNVTLGSEIAQWTELEAVYTRGEPILLHAWTPHWVQAKYELVEIELPPATDECWATDYGCDYPTDMCLNVASAAFVEKHPGVGEFWRNFFLTNDHQAQMIYTIDVDGADLEQTVRAWMAANEDLWRPWIPN